MWFTSYGSFYFYSIWFLLNYDMFFYFYGMWFYYTICGFTNTVCGFTIIAYVFFSYCRLKTVVTVN